MGTRSGDMDPAVPLHMMNSLNMSAKEMDTGGGAGGMLVLACIWAYTAADSNSSRWSGVS